MSKVLPLVYSASPKAVVDRLARCGFSIAESTAFQPGGEPDRAVGQRGKTTITLIRDIASRLCMLVADPDFPADVVQCMPLMLVTDAARLMGSNRPERQLAGLLAAEALADASLLSAVLRLAESADPTVAEAATRVAAALVGLPEPTDPVGALFALPGWRREKLQMLRWWMAEPPGDPAAVAGALARALKDPDWEIAVTAMLAAGRLRLRDLAPALARLRPPSGRRLGLAGQEPRLLLALRDACLARLGHPAGKPLPPGVAQAVAGDLSALAADFAALVASLALPLRPPPRPPAAKGVTLAPEGPRLADGTLLAWVPPGDYWLGDAHLTGSEPNPVRRVTLEAGFYIDARPRGPAPYPVAEDAARTMAGRLGRPVALPGPDQWEIAARGTDGRRFPWGANGAAGVRVDLSPAGMSGILTGPGEWLSAPATAEGMPLAGGAGAPVPAARRRAPGESPNSYRFVYVISNQLILNPPR